MFIYIIGYVLHHIFTNDAEEDILLDKLFYGKGAKNITELKMQLRDFNDKFPEDYTTIDKYLSKGNNLDENIKNLPIEEQVKLCTLETETGKILVEFVRNKYETIIMNAMVKNSKNSKIFTIVSEKHNTHCINCGCSMNSHSDKCDVCIFEKFYYIGVKMDATRPSLKEMEQCRDQAKRDTKIKDKLEKLEKHMKDGNLHEYFVDEGIYVCNEEFIL